MDGLRGWAASVIAAAVLAGVVEFVLPKGRLEKSVKVLVALFMLVSFRSPLVGLSAEPERIRSGLDALLAEHEAQQALEQTVRETLEREAAAAVAAFAAAEGIPVAGVTAAVRIDRDNNIAVSRIEIEMNGTQEERDKLDRYAFDSFRVHPIIRSAVTREGTT